MNSIKKIVLAFRTSIVVYLVYILNMYILNSDFLRNIPNKIWFVTIFILLIQIGISAIALPVLAFIMWPRNNKYQGFYFFMVGAIEGIILYLSSKVLTNNIASGVDGLVGAFAVLAMFWSCILTMLIGLIIEINNREKTN